MPHVTPAMRWGNIVRAAAAAALVLTACSALGQDLGRLDERLKPGDFVIVEMREGATVEGRTLEVSDSRLVVLSDDRRLEIAAEQIARVQRRRNGILLGAVIGTAAGVPFGLALRSYAYNEGGNEAAALLLPIAAGLGAGIAIDALLVRPRTVYDRSRDRNVRVSVLIGSRRRSVAVVISAIDDRKP